MELTEKKISSRQIFKGRVLSLSLDKVCLPDGKESERECVRHTGGAAVLFVLNGRIALVKQYRYLYSKAIYEIPAGKMDKGEEPCIAAARELLEETGYEAKVEKLLDIYPSPGYTDEVIHIYFADCGKFVGAKLDDGEFLNCEFLPAEEVLDMIERGEITDAKTVSAVYKYMLARRDGRI